MINTQACFIVYPYLVGNGGCEHRRKIHCDVKDILGYRTRIAVGEPLDRDLHDGDAHAAANGPEHEQTDEDDPLVLADREQQPLQHQEPEPDLQTESHADVVDDEAHEQAVRADADAR